MHFFEMMLTADNHCVISCRCHMVLRMIGQDESCYCAHAQPKKAWKMEGQTRMRKKTEGMGVMISLFIDSTSGIGFPMTADQLTAFNAQRVREGKTELTGFISHEPPSPNLRAPPISDAVQGLV
jgi:hypothetical protein